MLAAVTATEKAAAEAALLAAVHDDEENGRFVEDDEIGAAEEAAESATDGAAEARLAAVLDDEAHGRFVADEEVGANDAADADPCMDGEVETGDGSPSDDEEDDNPDDDEEVVQTDEYGYLFTGFSVEGRVLHDDRHASNWVAVNEMPAIPDTTSTLKESDGSLIYDSPPGSRRSARGTCLRVTPDYPGASSVTTVWIGHGSILAFDHTVRRTYDDPHGTRRTITFYRIRHSHAELDGRWLHDCNPELPDVSAISALRDDCE